MATQEEMLNMMNQMGMQNPKAQMLAQMLSQQSQAAEEDEGNDLKIKKLIRQIKKQASLIKQLATSNKKLKTKIKFLVENLNYRLEICDALAAATGSCPECWGEDLSCKNCNGQGSPGKMEINEEAFMTFIQPIIKHYTEPDQSPKYNANNNLNNSLN